MVNSGPGLADLVPSVSNNYVLNYEHIVSIYCVPCSSVYLVAFNLPTTLAGGYIALYRQGHQGSEK